MIKERQVHSSAKLLNPTNYFTSLRLDHSFGQNNWIHIHNTAKQLALTRHVFMTFKGH